MSSGKNETFEDYKKSITPNNFSDAVMQEIEIAWLSGRLSGLTSRNSHTKEIETNKRLFVRASIFDLMSNNSKIWGKLSGNCELFIFNPSQVPDPKNASIGNEKLVEIGIIPK